MFPVHITQNNPRADFTQLCTHTGAAWCPWGSLGVHAEGVSTEGVSIEGVSCPKSGWDHKGGGTRVDTKDTLFFSPCK